MLRCVMPKMAVTTAMDDVNIWISTWLAALL